MSLHDYIANVDRNQVSENCVREKNRKCGKCLKAIARNLNPICCNICEKSFHIKCTGLSNSHARLDAQKCAGYNCPKCVANSLPFADLDENKTYLEFNDSRISDSNWINKPSFTIQSLLDQMPGQKFESDELLSNSISSKYYKPSELPANNFTMLHINIASLSKHIDEL